MSMAEINLFEADGKRKSGVKSDIYILDKMIRKTMKLNDTHEGSCYNVSYKIFYDASITGNTKIKNVRVNDYFLNIFYKQISLKLSNHKLGKSLSYTAEKQKYLKNSLVDNRNLEINGRTVILYSLQSSLKLKYSLIKTNKNKKFNEIYDSDKNYADKTGYLNLIDKFAKNLDTNLAIDNINSLKSYFHRYGVNTSLEIFLLPKIKNQKVADLIKMNILVKMMKHLFNFHEGMNFLLKLNLMNANVASNSDSVKYMAENLAILNNGHFDFINEKNILNIQKMKIYHLIMTILDTSKSKESFVKFFYENLNFIFFFKMLKWKYIDECLGFNLFNEQDSFTAQKFSQENLLADFISTARKRPLCS